MPRLSGTQYHVGSTEAPSERPRTVERATTSEFPQTVSVCSLGDPDLRPLAICSHLKLAISHNGIQNHAHGGAAG